MTSEGSRKVHGRCVHSDAAKLAIDCNATRIVVTVGIVAAITESDYDGVVTILSCLRLDITRPITLKPKQVCGI